MADEARAALETPDRNREALRVQAAAALVANRAFLNVATPTNAEIVKQTKAHARQLNGVIRLLLNELDATD